MVVESLVVEGLGLYLVMFLNIPRSFNDSEI